MISWLLLFRNVIFLKLTRTNSARYDKLSAYSDRQIDSFHCTSVLQTYYICKHLSVLKIFQTRSRSREKCLSVSQCLSVCLSVCRKTPKLVKILQNFESFIWSAKYVYCYRRYKFATEAFFCNNQYFYIVSSDNTHTHTHTEGGGATMSQCGMSLHCA
jgi:hypothetical protein